MRVRTDEKRQAIIDAAKAAFGDMGYERASMSAIARIAGTSKQTLYGYFESKEHLFSVMMVEALTSKAEALFYGLLHDDGRSVQVILEAFGRDYIDFINSNEIMSVTRVVVSTGGIGDLGRHLYAQGPMRGWSAMADSLERWAQSGQLNIAKPLVAALHFKGLLEAGSVEARLYGAEPSMPRDEAVAEAVRVFFAAYGVTAEPSGS